MNDLVFGFVAGLLIGWNILSQPAWVKAILDKLLGRA